MRQLTPLDAEFLAIETSRTYGHVGGLAVYDPSTAPGGRLDIPEICNVVSERLHMLPPFRWKLVQVPLRLDLPLRKRGLDGVLSYGAVEPAVMGAPAHDGQ